MQRTRLMNAGNRSLWRLSQWHSSALSLSLVSSLREVYPVRFTISTSFLLQNRCMFVPNSNAHSFRGGPRKPSRVALAALCQRASPGFCPPPLADGGTRVSRPAFLRTTQGSWSLELHLGFRCRRLHTSLVWFAVEGGGGSPTPRETPRIHI